MYKYIVWRNREKIGEYDADSPEDAILVAQGEWWAATQNGPKVTGEWRAQKIKYMKEVKQ